MTVCIAAIAEKKQIVAVTDKMLTIGTPIATSFEINESNKVSQLSDKVLALFAGDVVHANEILKIARSKLSATSSTDVFKCAEAVKDAYQEFWEKLVSNYLYTRYKITLEQFMNNQGSFEGELIKHVNSIATKFSIDVQILVAGIDNLPHIYYIDNECTVTERSPLGYACIGSGQQHATLSMIESQYDTSFDKYKATYTALQAKKKAEYDPGVGVTTDVAYIDGGYKKLDEATVSSIEDVYNNSVESISEIKSENITALRELKGLK